MTVNEVCINKINYKALLINKQKTICFHNFDLLHCKNSQRISNRKLLFQHKVTKLPLVSKTRSKCFIPRHCSKETNYFNTHQIGGSCHQGLASSNRILVRKDSPKKEVQINDF